MQNALAAVQQCLFLWTQACKYVHKVVKDAPLRADLEFIKKHQIHCFAVGEEYVLVLVLWLNCVIYAELRGRGQSDASTPIHRNIGVCLCLCRYVNDEEDTYYTVARKMGILVATSRTGGISTSDLIRRIESRDKKSLGRVAPAKQGI